MSLKAVAGGGGGTPAGATNDIQINNAGAFGALTPGTGISTFLATPSSANLRAALTDEAGTGSAYFTGGALGTPASGTATNLTGTASGLTAGNVTTNANLTGAVTSVGNATSLGSFSSSDLAAALTDEVGSGNVVFSAGTLNVTTGKTLAATNNITLVGTDGVSANVSNLKVRTIGFSTTSPATGQQGSYVVFPVAGTITGYKIVADAGTCTVKTWKIASGTTAPTSANLISTSGVSLSSGSAIISSTVSDFTTTTVSANDIFAFDLSAYATATKILYELEITVT